MTMLFKVVTCFFVLVYCNCLAMKLYPRDKLIIDEDGGADDAMAIFMALLCEKCHRGPKVVALTTTHGNVDEDQAFINTQKILDVAGRSNIPVYRGANLSLILDVQTDSFFGEDGLGELEDFEFESIPETNLHAALALIKYSKLYKDELVIVSLGAATNLALAIRLDKGFLGRIKHLYLGAGHIKSENFLKPEFNAEQDVEAYFITVRDAMPDKVTVIPYSQVLSTMNISKDWRVNTLGSVKKEVIQVQNEFERISMTKIENGIWGLLDPVVMAIYLDSTVIGETKYTNNSIILWGKERGINTNKFGNKSESNVKIINSMRDKPYQELLIKLFSEC